MPRGPKIPSAEARKWLQEHEGGASLDKLAARYRKTKRTVADNIDRARQQRSFELAQQDRLQGAVAGHQDDMLGLVERLGDVVHVLPLESSPDPVDFGLEELLEPPDLLRACQASIGKGAAIVRDESGPRSVRLTEEDSRPWDFLRQHLGSKDPIWHYLVDWQRALLDEANARARLNRVIVKKAREVFGLPAALGSAAQDPHLTQALPSLARAEITKRSLGQAATDLRDRVRVQHGALEDIQSNKSLSVHLQPKDAEKAVENLVNLVDSLTNTTEAHQAADKYRDLESRTNEARAALEEYGFLRYIRGTCSLCKKLGAPV